MEAKITVGIAGHVDHGKTTLVRTLTGIDTNRMKEEKKRGLSIEFGVARLKLSRGMQVSLIDVPGHTDFMKNTIRGLNAVDAAVLVVAADDGVMPQTKEHLEILRFFGAENGFVVLSKADLVDVDTLELATLEIDDLTAGTFLENCPIIPFYGSTGMGCKKIIQALEGIIETTHRKKEVHKPFRLFIDQIRTFQGIGTVVSGTILSGVIRRGDTIEILPSCLSSSVRSLETHHEETESEAAGARVGINLRGISSQKISRGMVVAQPGSLAAKPFLNAELSISTFSQMSVGSGQRIRVHLGTASEEALLVIMEGQRLVPGETGLVQLRLKGSIGAISGDRFVITPLNTAGIIGGGRVLEATCLKFRKVHAWRLVPFLNAVRDQDISGIVKAIVEACPEKTLCPEELCRASGMERGLFKEVLSREESEGRLVIIGKGRYLPRHTFDKIMNDVGSFIKNTLRDDPTRQHVGTAGIKSYFLNRIESSVIDSVLKKLIDQRALIAVNGGYSIRSVYDKRAVSRDRLIQQALNAVEVSGPVPLTVSAVRDHLEPRPEKKDVKRILEQQVDRGDIIRLDNERYLSRKGLEIIKDQVKSRIAAHGSMTLADCPEVLGYGRTVGAFVMDYLEMIRFTRRRGNEHVLHTRNRVS